jgi:hypothetical protein
MNCSATVTTLQHAHQAQNSARAQVTRAKREQPQAGRIAGTGPPARHRRCTLCSGHLARFEPKGSAWLLGRFSGSRRAHSRPQWGTLQGFAQMLFRSEFHVVYLPRVLQERGRRAGGLTPLRKSILALKRVRRHVLNMLSCSRLAGVMLSSLVQARRHVEGDGCRLRVRKAPAHRTTTRLARPAGLSARMINAQRRRSTPGHA